MINYVLCLDKIPQLCLEPLSVMKMMMLLASVAPIFLRLKQKTKLPVIKTDRLGILVGGHFKLGYTTKALA